MRGQCIMRELLSQSYRGELSNTKLQTINVCRPLDACNSNSSQVPATT